MSKSPDGSDRGRQDRGEAGRNLGGVGAGELSGESAGEDRLSFFSGGQLLLH